MTEYSPITRIKCEGGLGPMRETGCLCRWRIANGQDDGTVALSPSRKCIECPHGAARAARPEVVEAFKVVHPFPNLIRARRVHAAVVALSLRPPSAAPLRIVPGAASAPAPALSSKSKKCRRQKCPVMFVPTKGQRYHTPECQELNQQELAAARAAGLAPMAPRHVCCQYRACGKELPPPPSSGRRPNRSYCNEECSWKERALVQKANRQAEAERRWSKAVPPRQCEWPGCGRMFTPNPKAGRHKYCPRCRSGKRHVFTIRDDSPVLIRTPFPERVVVVQATDIARPTPTTTPPAAAEGSPS